MLEFSKEKHNCTGCTACASVCPVNCIKMEQDEEGFLYPVSGPECIHCGKCEDICPIKNEKKWKTEENISIQQAYCGITKDSKIWNDSSSGGAFTEICNAFGDDQTAIYGASWYDMTVVHRRVIGPDSIAPLRKSKYIESDLNNCFSQIKKDLKDGRKVIFVGTPCEVAGLKQYIGLSTENLLLVDLICHGVGSPKVFEACVDALSAQYEGKVTGYEFRAKRGYHERDHLIKIELENRSEKYIVDTPFMQLFLRQDCLRPSCGMNCRYRCEYRQGDITIADFKGLTEVFPDLIGVKKNYSSLIFNTNNGLSLLNKLKEQMVLRKCDIEFIKKYNPLFYRNTVASKNRNDFFVAFCKNPGKAIIENTCPSVIIKQNTVQKISARVPQPIRRSVIKIIMKIKH